ncbi:unnamed protein product [Eruca vesicaria subsp. sativa]|uniref:KOW domain-containing protein n=1 Tax=Eruca vesicaria subsp. sativa TaxID=29727 RepID=A0ABC8L496_ERUVS|nr:unnamed protein product [Eruca vesicaria subsp. sativa]
MLDSSYNRIVGFDSWVGGEKLLVSVFGAYNRTLGLIFRDFECQESTEVAIVGEDLSDQEAELRIGDGSVEIPCVKLCYQQKKATLVVPSFESVIIIRGKDKGETGTIKHVIRSQNRVIVEGKNLIKKHIKGGSDHEGGIFTVEAPLHASNVQVVDPVTGYVCMISLHTDHACV